MAYIIAAIIILIIILILMGILLVPFQISLRLYSRESVNKGYFKLSWLKIRLIRRKIQGDKKKPKKPKEENKIDFNRIPKIMGNLEQSLPSILRIFQAFFRSVSINKISINSIVGLDSPADTAIINGFLLGLASIINIFPKTNFTVDPDFNEERIDGSLLVEIKLRLFWIVIETLRAFTKKPVRSLIGELRKMRG